VVFSLCAENLPNIIEDEEGRQAEFGVRRGCWDVANYVTQTVSLRGMANAQLSSSEPSAN